MKRADFSRRYVHRKSAKQPFLRILAHARGLKSGSERNPTCLTGKTRANPLEHISAAIWAVPVVERPRLGRVAPRQVHGLAGEGGDLHSLIPRDARGHRGLPIAGEKKTTNFQMTPVQKPLSQTTEFERPQGLLERPRDSAEFRCSITALECVFSNQPLGDGFREGETP
jgi:hypothetical protein